MNTIKTLLEIIVLIFTIISFWYGRQLLRYKLDEGTRKLYLENCFKIRVVLDKFKKNGAITSDDINTIALANQEAELYLNDEIIELTKNIHADLAHYYSYIKENEIKNERNDKEEILKLKDKILKYKKNLYIYYRKHLIYEEWNWIKNLKIQLNKIKNKMSIVKILLLIFTTLIIFAVPALATSNWVQIDNNTYIDTNSLRKENDFELNNDNYYSIWSKKLNNGSRTFLNMESFYKSKIWFSLEQVYFDCKNKRLALKSYIDYDSVGNVIVNNTINNYNLLFDNIAPGTIGERIYDYACQVSNVGY